MHTSTRLSLQVVDLELLHNHHHLVPLLFYPTPFEPTRTHTKYHSISEPTISLQPTACRERHRPVTAPKTASSRARTFPSPATLPTAPISHLTPARPRTMNFFGRPRARSPAETVKALRDNVLRLGQAGSGESKRRVSPACLRNGCGGVLFGSSEQRA